MLSNHKGFTLVELLVGLVIASLLVLGVTGTYSSISSSVNTSKELENAQEVIRYTSQVFTRSLKQTRELPTIVANEFVVEQPANTRSCLGTMPNVTYTETFSFSSPNLRCRIDDGNDTTLLTGVADIDFVVNGLLVTVTVLPDFLPENFLDGGVNGLNIDIAVSTLILQTAMPE